MVPSASLKASLNFIRIFLANLMISQCTNVQYLLPNSKMQEVVNFWEDWATQNKMELNTGKTKDMWIGFTRSSPAPPSISIGNEMIERVTKFKLLGVTMNESLQESKSPKQYRANNLLHKDKTHTGICGTNLGWLTILPKGGYRKSTKSLFRYHWLTKKQN